MSNLYDDVIKKFYEILNDLSYKDTYMSILNTTAFIRKLNKADRKLIFQEYARIFSAQDNTKLKVVMLMVLNSLRGNDTADFLKKVINEGEEMHGEEVILQAKMSLDSIREITIEEFLNETNEAIKEVEDEKIQMINKGTENEIIDMVDKIIVELHKFKSQAESNNMLSKAQRTTTCIDNCSSKVFGFSKLGNKVTTVSYDYEYRLD